jgi:hypothetical protein
MSPTPRPGDQVTVIARPGDAYILNFQRFATVVRVTDRGEVFVRLDDVVPRDQEFGPLGSTQLQPGWRDETGRWRIP